MVVDEFEEIRQGIRSKDTRLWKAWFDGSCEPNPGKMRIGALLVSPDGKKIELAESLGQGTNNVAEYSAFIAVLQAALSIGITNLLVHGDSTLVVRQVSGDWEIKTEGLRLLHSKACQLAERFDNFQIIWVPRKQNTHADALSSGRALKLPPDTEKISKVKLRHEGGDEWTAFGSKGENYSVNTGNQTCTCFNFVNTRRGRSACKHITAACQASPKAEEDDPL